MTSPQCRTLLTRREKKRLKKLENRRLNKTIFYPTTATTASVTVQETQTKTPSKSLSPNNTNKQSPNKNFQHKTKQLKNRRHSLETGVSRLKLTDSSFRSSQHSQTDPPKYQKYLTCQTFVRAVKPENRFLFNSDLEVPIASHLSPSQHHTTDSNTSNNNNTNKSNLKNENNNSDYQNKTKKVNVFESIITNTSKT
jgi:hypothetical protein